MRNKFELELEALNNELIEMGSLIEAAIGQAVLAMMQKDKAIAKATIVADNEINEKEREIERRCLKLLLQQQPVARDLRIISTALKMITDMERIGDHASDISEVTLHMLEGENYKLLDHIPQMAEATVKMVKGSIDAFVERNLTLAEEIIAYDDVVDDLFDKVRKDLVELIRDDKDHGNLVIDLLMIAKYFERIGDHAVNIGEWVIFSITGTHKSERVL